MVDVTDEMTFSDVLYAADDTGLFNYGARFSLLFTSPVRQRDFAAFKSALITIWEQARAGRLCLRMIVSWDLNIPSCEITFQVFY